MSTQESTPAAVTYDFLSADMTEVFARIDKVNTRLFKACLPQFTWDTEDYTVAVTEDLVTRIESHTKLTLSQASICFAGWNFLARVDRIAKDTYVTAAVPGVELGWEPDSWECDHCHTKRNRKSQYLIENQDNGDRMLVGASCLELFLGVKPDGLWAVGLLPEISDLDGNHATSKACQYPVTEILAITKAVVDQLGYHNKQSEFPTVNAVKSVLSPTTDDDAKKFAQDMYEASTHIDGDKLRDEIINALSPTSDWAANIIALFSVPAIDWKHLGLVISSIVAVTKRAEHRPEFVNEFYLTPKDKFETKATVARVSYGESNYGYYPTPMTYITFRSEDGHRLFWATSANVDPEEGQEVTLKGTIKSHDVYKDQKSTKVTRCKILL